MSTPSAPASACNDRCQFGRAAIPEPQSQLDATTRFCRVSELDLSRAEVEAVLEEGRRLGLRVWNGLGCGDTGSMVTLTVKQARLAPDGDEAWRIPFEIHVPIELQRSGSVVVQHQRGGWAFTRIEYEP